MSDVPAEFGERRSAWRRRSWRGLTRAAAILLGLAGCGGPGTDDAGDGGPAPPSWLAELPTTATTIPAGGVVWAVVPELGSEAAKIATYRVVEAETGTVLVDTLGNRFADVPGALVHAAPGASAAELEAGTPVLASRWDAGRIIGRVASVDGETLTVSHDWNGATVNGVMDVVVPLPAADESPVLQWVAYPSPEAAEGDASVWLKGLCFAEHGGQLWLSDDSGNVEIVAQDAVKVLVDLGRLEPAAGDRVSAYSWGSGFEPGVIAEVLEPGLRYGVTLESGETRVVFFGDLTQAL